MLSYGYLKDAAATVVFAFALTLLSKPGFTISKEWLVAFFVLAFFTDFLYTIWSPLHDMPLTDRRGVVAHAMLCVMIIATVMWLLHQRIPIRTRCP
jgi:hypothetical protein